MKAKKPGRAAQLAAAAFREYGANLHRYVLRRLRQPEDAPDVTQEIFERFLKVERSDAIRNPQAYLFKVASHVVSEALYKQEQNLVTYDSELLEQVTESAGTGSSGEMAEVLGIQRDIREALLKLPDNYLAALLLVKGEGLSYEEAAREAGFTESTIGTYVTHARARLKLILEDYWRNKEKRP